MRIELYKKIWKLDKFINVKIIYLEVILLCEINY